MSIDIFHDHLDKCSQCANQPLNLCPVGARVLELAAADLPTGRTRREPEMQRLPISEEARALREAFTPSERRIKYPEDRLRLDTDFSALEMRVLREANVYASLNPSAPKSSPDPESTGLVCSECGAEEGLSLTHPCPSCSSPRIVLCQVLLDLFGPNFRDFIPNKKAP